MTHEASLPQETGPKEVRFFEPQNAGLQARLLAGVNNLRLNDRTFKFNNSVELTIRDVGQNGSSRIDLPTKTIYEVASRAERHEFWEGSDLPYERQMAQWTDSMNGYLTKVSADDQKRKFLEKITITDAKAIDRYARESDMTGFIDSIRAKVVNGEISIDDIHNNMDVISKLSISFGYDSRRITTHLLGGTLNAWQDADGYINAVKDTFDKVDPFGRRLLSDIRQHAGFQERRTAQRRTLLPVPIPSDEKNTQPAEVQEKVEGKEQVVFPEPVQEEDADLEQATHSNPREESEQLIEITVGEVYDIKGRASMQDFLVSVPSNYGGFPDQSFFAVYDGHGERIITPEEANSIYQVQLEQKQHGKNEAEAYKHAKEYVAPDLKDSGAKVAALAAEKLHNIFFTHLRRGMNEREAFIAAYAEVDQQASDLGEIYSNVGTTAATVFRKGKNLSIAHAGDTRVVLIEEGRLVWATKDHGVGRYVTRSIGDHVHRQGESDDFIPVKPDIEEFELNNKKYRLIIASDGLWGNANNVTNEQAVELIRNETDAQSAANILKETAKDLNDNITILVVDISPEALTK